MSNSSSSSEIYFISPEWPSLKRLSVCEDCTPSLPSESTMPESWDSMPSSLESMSFVKDDSLVDVESSSRITREGGGVTIGVSAAEGHPSTLAARVADRASLRVPDGERSAASEVVFDRVSSLSLLPKAKAARTQTRSSTTRSLMMAKIFGLIRGAGFQDIVTY